MFNQRLRFLREETGMTQNEVAEKISISPRVYAYYETERFPKSAETIKNLAKLFNCTTDYLLGASDFRNHEETQNINDSADVFNQIKNPLVLESMKDTFNIMADIGKSFDDKSYAVAHCMSSLAGSLNEIFSSYRSSIEELKITVPEEIQKLKFYEFKAFSTERIDASLESIKAMANDLASRIKINIDPDGE